MVDVLDKKILAVVDWEARLPISQIAKRVRSNKDVVLNRIKRLEESGIITQYYPVLNLGKLGYFTHRLNFQVEELSEEREKQFIHFLDKEINAGLIYKMDQQFQYGVYIWTSSVYELEKLLLKIKKFLGRSLVEYKLHLLCSIRQYPKDAVFEKEEHTMYVKIEGGEKLGVDKEDFLILKELEKNARISTVELSKRTNIPQQTVSYKIKMLEKKKIILGYRAEIKIQKLGFEHFALEIYLFDQSQMDKFRLWADLDPHVTWFETAVGGVDLDIALEVKDRNELEKKLNELKKKFPDIRKINIIAERYWKLTYVPTVEKF